MNSDFSGRVLGEHADVFRDDMIAKAISATKILEEMGITVLIGGSLAKGNPDKTSDIDFLVTSCPIDLKYRIEAQVEDCLGNIPFDVLYLDEIRPERQNSYIEGALNARDLR